MLPLVYQELRKLAAAKLAAEKPGQTLQPTALVHEAYIRLVDAEHAQRWNGRAHFFGAAAEAMRRILVDRARERRSLKRGGDRMRVDVAEFEAPEPELQVDLLALDDALDHLTAVDPRRAELVKLRYFAGLTNQAAAELLSMGCGRSIPESELPGSVENSLGMKFVLIHSGSFTMGTPETEPERDTDEKQHEVTLTQPFYLGVYEVTQAQYAKVMGQNPSSSLPAAAGITDTSNFPVDSLCWADASAFCDALSRLTDERQAGRRYRLPTEAEWEYSCRANTDTMFSFSDDAELLGEYGWFEGNSDQRSHPVGDKKPNQWGLYDMHGNATELCWDYYTKDLVDAQDPRGPINDEYRCRRGGGWFFASKHCRSGARDSCVPDGRPGNHGLRVVLIP